MNTERSRCETIRDYMLGDGFLSTQPDCYVVWIIGPTDGWPRAIFDNLDDAKIYAERFTETEIMRVNFKLLVKVINEAL